jgi:hypothetical protein
VVGEVGADGSGGSDGSTEERVLAPSWLAPSWSTSGGTDARSRANETWRSCNFLVVLPLSSKITANHSVHFLHDGKCSSLRGQQISLGVSVLKMMMS